MKKNIIKQRGSALKERKLNTKAAESFIINYTLEEALDIFLRAKVAEGVRRRTLNEYVQHIRYLTEYLSVYQPAFVHVSDLTPSVIRDYITFSKNKRAYAGNEQREKTTTLSVNTINIRLRTLRTMCNFWFEESLISDNPMKNIKSRSSSFSRVVSLFCFRGLLFLFFALSDIRWTSFLSGQGFSATLKKRFLPRSD